MNNFKKKNVLTAALCLFVLGAGASCGRVTEEPFIVVAENSESTKYTACTVTRGDLVLSKKVSATYTQQAEQAVSFSVSGKKVNNVYVAAGDKVKKGDLLAQLLSTDLEKEISELEYEKERAEVLLKLMLKDVPEAFEGFTNKEYAIEDTCDTIEIYDMKLKSLKEELEEGRVYSEIDGTVTWVKKNLQGSVATIGERVINVVDDDSMVFKVTKNNYTINLKSTENVTMKVNTGTYAGTYELTPVKTDEWGDFLYYKTVDETEFSVGTIGYITIVLDSRTDILRVPLRAIHTLGDQNYVYVANEAGVREARWVTVGLTGNDGIEIVSGLSEGDTVILK